MAVDFAVNTQFISLGHNVRNSKGQEVPFIAKPNNMTAHFTKLEVESMYTDWVRGRRSSAFDGWLESDNKCVTMLATTLQFVEPITSTTSFTAEFELKLVDYKDKNDDIVVNGMKDVMSMWGPILPNYTTGVSEDVTITVTDPNTDSVSAYTIIRPVYISLGKLRINNTKCPYRVKVLSQYYSGYTADNVDSIYDIIKEGRYLNPVRMDATVGPVTVGSNVGTTISYSQTLTEDLYLDKVSFIKTSDGTTVEYTDTDSMLSGYNKVRGIQTTMYLMNNPAVVPDMYQVLSKYSTDADGNTVTEEYEYLLGGTDIDSGLDYAKSAYAGVANPVQIKLDYTSANTKIGHLNTDVDGINTMTNTNVCRSVLEPVIDTFVDEYHEEYTKLVDIGYSSSLSGLELDMLTDVYNNVTEYEVADGSMGYTVKDYYSTTEKYREVDKRILVSGSLLHYVDDKRLPLLYEMIGYTSDDKFRYWINLDGNAMPSIQFHDDVNTYDDWSDLSIAIRDTILPESRYNGVYPVLRESSFIKVWYDTYQASVVVPTDMYEYSILKNNGNSMYDVLLPRYKYDYNKPLVVELPTVPEGVGQYVNTSDTIDYIRISNITDDSVTGTCEITVLDEVGYENTANMSVQDTVEVLEDAPDLHQDFATYTGWTPYGSVTAFYNESSDPAYSTKLNYYCQQEYVYVPNGGSYSVTRCYTSSVAKTFDISSVPVVTNSDYRKFNVTLNVRSDAGLNGGSIVVAGSGMQALYHHLSIGNTTFDMNIPSVTTSVTVSIRGGNSNAPLDLISLQVGYYVGEPVYVSNVVVDYSGTEDKLVPFKVDSLTPATGLLNSHVTASVALTDTDVYTPFIKSLEAVSIAENNILVEDFIFTGILDDYEQTFKISLDVGFDRYIPVSVDIVKNGSALLVQNEDAGASTLVDYSSDIHEENSIKNISTLEDVYRVNAEFAPEAVVNKLSVAPGQEDTIYNCEVQIGGVTKSIPVKVSIDIAGDPIYGGFKSSYYKMYGEVVTIPANSSVNVIASGMFEWETTPSRAVFDVFADGTEYDGIDINKLRVEDVLITECTANGDIIGYVDDVEIDNDVALVGSTFGSDTIDMTNSSNEDKTVKLVVATRYVG